MPMKMLPNPREQKSIHYCLCGHEKSQHWETADLEIGDCTYCSCGGFQEAVQQSWFCKCRHGTALHTLDACSACDCGGYDPEEVGLTYHPGKGVGCEHRGDVAVYANHGTILHGANLSGIQPTDGQMVVDLDGTAIELLMEMTPALKELEGKRPFPTYLYCPVEGATIGGTPDPEVFGADFWRLLWVLLPEGKVVFACQGGHTLVGVALASLMVVDGLDPKDAIEQVNTRYCKFGIITNKERGYIHALK